MLTGARQAGKSTMLKTTLKGVNYVALDRPIIRESAIHEPSLFFQRYSPPVIVDEIQKAAQLGGQSGSTLGWNYALIFSVPEDATGIDGDPITVPANKKN